MSKNDSNDEKSVASKCEEQKKSKSDKTSEKKYAGPKENKSSHSHRENINNENKLARCLTDLEQLQGQYKRVNADFDNFKRRMEKEQTQWYQTAQAKLLLDVLAIVDDFDRALADKQKQKDGAQLKGAFEGFELIYKSLQKLLQTYDVIEIEQMTEFDPNLHEALAQIDSPEHTSGQIVDVMQKGYMFKDQVLRPAKVAVAR